MLHAVGFPASELDVGDVVAFGGINPIYAHIERGGPIPPMASHNVSRQRATSFLSLPKINDIFGFKVPLMAAVAPAGFQSVQRVTYIFFVTSVSQFISLIYLTGLTRFDSVFAC